MKQPVYKIDLSINGDEYQLLTLNPQRTNYNGYYKEQEPIGYIEFSESEY